MVAGVYGVGTGRDWRMSYTAWLAELKGAWLQVKPQKPICHDEGPCMRFKKYGLPECKGNQCARRDYLIGVERVR